MTGTAGPSVSTLLGGSGTLGQQVGTLVGGTATTPGSTGTLSGGTGVINSTTGTLSQSGPAAIAGTSGSTSLAVSEVAVSEPITVIIHQSQRNPGSTLRAQSRIVAGGEGGSRVQPSSPAGPQAQALKALRAARGRRR